MSAPPPDPSILAGILDFIKGTLATPGAIAASGAAAVLTAIGTAVGVNKSRKNDAKLDREQRGQIARDDLEARAKDRAIAERAVKEAAEDRKRQAEVQQGQLAALERQGAALERQGAESNVTMQALMAILRRMEGMDPPGKQGKKPTDPPPETPGPPEAETAPQLENYTSDRARRLPAWVTRLNGTKPRGIDALEERSPDLANALALTTREPKEEWAGLLGPVLWSTSSGNEVELSAALSEVRRLVEGAAEDEERDHWRAVERLIGEHRPDHAR